MKQPNWSYQPQMIADALNAVRTTVTHRPSPDKGCVLAGSMSSGKTRMALLIIDQLLKDGVIQNVLISTHGQTVLRSQMAEEAAKLKAQGLISFGFDTYTESKQFQQEPPQVVIALPQTVARLEHVPLFDLVVVDEAHEFYFAKDGMLQRIIKECKALYSIFLTGTPSKFIADKRFPIVAAASPFDLLAHGVVSSPAIRLCTSSYDFTQNDYNESDNLSEKAQESPEQTKSTMDDVLSVIHRELASRLRTSPRANQILNVFNLQKLKEILPSFGKTMFACHSIRQARQVRDYFESKGISVTMSTSEEGEDAGKLAEFTTDPKQLVLIVVRRGILGFSCGELVNLVDMTCTQNVDRLSQLFGRILRLHPDGKEKLFLKVVPHKLAEYNYYLLSFVLSLCDHDRYVSYAGGESTTFRAREFKQKGDKQATGKEKGEAREKKSLPPVWEWDLELLGKVYTKSDELLSDYATTTLREVQLLLGTREKRSAHEWVPVAEKLALDNGGKLPVAQWLRVNKFVGLYSAMGLRPELFSHIPQEDKGRKSPQEWVPVAETLALENGGKCPNGKWLVKHGYSGLNCAMNTYKDLFVHIPQDKKRDNTPQGWVPIAEKLALDNGGVLPYSEWLVKNGYSGLTVILKPHAALFAHIPQEKRKGKSPQEWVPVAERLALDNGGNLPSGLKKGYGGMLTAMFHNPDLFAHIPRQVAKKGPRKKVTV